MRYHIVHATKYSGSEPVSVGHNVAWLTPRMTNRQRVHSHSLQITPEPSVVSTRTDYFGNMVSQFSFNQGYHTLTVTGVNDVELLVPPATETGGPPWEHVARSLVQHTNTAELDAFEFVFDSPRCRRRSEFAQYARSSFLPGQPILDACRHLMRRIYSEHQFDPSATTVSTPVEQFFRQRRGVCQDFSQLMISMLRSLGLAARYMSGYLRTKPPPGGVRLAGADASHAWVAVYCGELGWIEFDPTNNFIPSTDHIIVGWGRDFGDVTPLKGVYIGGGKLNLAVSVDVTLADQGSTEGNDLMLPS